MSPLAYRIVKQLTLPVKRRTINDHADLLGRMDDVFCFELSAVAELLEDLGSRMWEMGRLGGRLSFLPAPKTWVEWDLGPAVRGRLGCLLEPADDLGEIARLSMCVELPDGIGTRRFGHMALAPDPRLAHKGWYIPDAVDNCCLNIYGNLVGWMHAALALINTPRIIGRTTHLPSKLLERQLRQSKSTGRHYPLHAWNEIRLEVTPPRLADEAGVTRLTGKRALHWCRSHLRCQGGMLVIVRGHYRGDAAVGIKQQRYAVEPGDRAAGVVQAIARNRIPGYE